MNKMKKNFLMFAALVAATLGFTACSSENDLPNEDPNERGVVKTQFTIAFPRKAVQGTRMAAGNVQLAPSDFRGITDIELYPFMEASIDGNTTLQFPKIKLYEGTTEGTLAGASSFYVTSNSHLYQDVDIPIGTKTFMFYGEATRNNQDADVIGKLEPTKATSGQKLSTIKFSPSVIWKSTSDADENGVIKEDKEGGKLALYLTGIANAKASNDATNTWANTKNVPLQELYTNFTSMKAGSWANAKSVVKQLYEAVKTPLTSDSQTTIDLKAGIKSAILNSTYQVTETGTGDAVTVSFGYNFGEYPRNYKLPDGAAYIKWQDGAFHEKTNNETTGWNMASFAKYAYPASLFYHVISDLVTSNTSKSTLYTGNPGVGSTGTPAGSTEASNWAAIVSNYTDGTAVAKETRAIAIVKQIQYAVGRLDVKLFTEVTSFQDKKGTNTVTIGGTTFLVTGLLVNGQKAVDYKFNQKTDEENEYTLYDQNIKARVNSADADVYMTTTASQPFYTLVLETPEYGETEALKTAAKVQIAVELENNTEYTFAGRDGWVYPHTRFYLVGTIDPSKNDGGTENNGTGTNYRDGNGQLIKKAFMQDYNTQVTLKLTDLSKAYNVLPDLSLPRLEMGLSVDVTWKPGLEQEITVE